MRPWLIVAGDLSVHGGMDMANYGLARYLARRGRGEVHLVAHGIAPDLAALPGIRAHRAARPLGRHRLGEPLLRAAARRWNRRLAGSGVRTVANGGNAVDADVAWVHYVHAAFEPSAAGPVNAHRVASNHRRHLLDEQRALQRARLVLCNSRRTAEDAVRLAGVSRDRVQVVYYGIDAARFGPAEHTQRASARAALGIAPGRRVALFAGQLGDRRKNFDTLLEAWRILCERPEWDVDLLVAGTGAELAAWRARAAARFIDGRVRFLGFRRDMPAVLAACDVLVHPARYEPYGLAVHEALCRGVPAIVSDAAGIAERYPDELRGLLLHNPEDPAELAARLIAWRSGDEPREAVEGFGAVLRSRTWDDMGRDIADLVEAWV